MLRDVLYLALTLKVNEPSRLPRLLRFKISIKDRLQAFEGFFPLRAQRLSRAHPKPSKSRSHRLELVVRDTESTTSFTFPR